MSVTLPMYMSFIMNAFVFYRLINPCSSTVCGPTYSFHNDLPLTANIDAFVDSVNGVNVSSNIDHPEGGMDAMMQVVVCKVKRHEKESLATFQPSPFVCVLKIFT